jgi:hypothetical protein
MGPNPNAFDGKLKRRKVLKATGASVGVAGFAGRARADDCSNEKCPIDRIDSSTCEVIYDSYNDTVETVKDGIEEYMNYEDCDYWIRDNNVYMDDGCVWGLSGDGCGESSISYTVPSAPQDDYEYDIKLSSEDTDEFETLLENGNNAGWALTGAMISTQNYPIAAGAAIFAYYTSQLHADVQDARDGCGVVISMDHDFPNPGKPLDEALDYYDWRVYAQ